MNLFTRKSLAQLDEEVEHNPLRRTLGRIQLIALGVGSIIGTGIFVLTGTAASQNAGPALIISMIISHTGCHHGTPWSGGRRPEWKNNDGDFQSAGGTEISRPATRHACGHIGLARDLHSSFYRCRGGAYGYSPLLEVKCS